MGAGTTDLSAVATDEILVRFVHPNHYSRTAPDGSRVTLANLRREEFEPAGQHQPSVYVESICSVAELEAANARWVAYGILKVRVRELETLGLRVFLTPEQCLVDRIRHAHASIFGVTGENRQRVIDLFGRCVTREPA
jgi:hypothetical protein